MDTKVCFKCRKDKPLSEFYRHKQMADGHLNKCKACTLQDVKKHRQDNLEKVREYDRQRGKLPHRVAARNDYSKTDRGRERQRAGSFAWSKRNPDKRQAYTAVWSAMRSGHLKKKPCEFCGLQEPVEAHHPDYTRPLEIMWLCKDCHIREHARQRREARRNPSTS